MSRRGFALVAVLWTVTLLAGAVGVGLAGVRAAQRAAHNRIALARGRWAAEACLAIAAARWGAESFRDTATVDLGRSVTCRWRADDPTARVNVNTADSGTLVRLFQNVGLPTDSAGHLATQILGLRRTGSITDTEQLAMLGGFDSRVVPFVTADGAGVVNASAASREVLAALPGITAEAVHRIETGRTAGRPVESLDHLASLLSPAGREALLAGYADLARLLVFRRTQLVLIADGWVASYGARPRASIELLVAALPERLAVLRRRMR